MWSGVKDAFWGRGRKRETSLNIQQLNGDSGEEDVTEETKSRQSQSDWDVCGNRFEDLDDKIQKKKSKSFSSEKLRSPSLMFWRQTEDTSDNPLQKGSNARGLSSGSLSFTLWSQTSDLSASEGEPYDERFRRSHSKRSSSFLSWRSHSQTEDAIEETKTAVGVGEQLSPARPTATIKKSGSVLSWLPSEECGSVASEGSQSGSQPRGQSQDQGSSEKGKGGEGERKLRRKSSLLQKLRNGLELSPGQTGEGEGRSPVVSDEEDDSQHVRRLSSFLQKLSRLSGGGGTPAPARGGGGEGGGQDGGVGGEIGLSTVSVEGGGGGGEAASLPADASCPASCMHAS